MTTAITIDNVDNLDKYVPTELTEALYNAHADTSTCMVIVSRDEVYNYLTGTIASYVTELYKAVTADPPDASEDIMFYVEWSRTAIEARDKIARATADRFYMVP